MSSRKNTKSLLKKNKLSLIDQPAMAPEDIVDLNEIFNKNVTTSDKIFNLYDFFSQKDGSSVIRNWSKSFNKKGSVSETQSYQELLSLILRLSGCVIDSKEIQIENKSLDTILDDFRKNVRKNKQSPPLYKFLKSKQEIILIFWKEISESLITNNVFASDMFKVFMEWIIAFNCCKIRVIRECSSLFICSLFESLANSISWRKGEIKKAQQKSNTNSKTQSNDQHSLFEKEISLYSSIANDLYKKLLVVRVRDIDDQIRNWTIKSLTNAITLCDIEFFDEQKIKYIGRALNDVSPINRLEALKCCEKLIIHAKDYVANSSKTNDPDNNNSFSDTENINHHESNNHIFEFSNAEEQKDDLSRINNTLIEFIEIYSPRIIEMCNDLDEQVAAEAISCSGILVDRQLINLDFCQKIKNLISDDSSIIRKAAANFIAKNIFFDDEENDNLEHFLLFIRSYNFKKDIQFIVSSLYPYLKCLKKWNEMCDRLISEENDDKSNIISSILLYSAKIAFNMAENYNENNVTKVKSSPETENNAKAIKKARKLTFVLIQNLPQLLKAYQSSKNKEIIQNLVEVSSLLDLNAISENSCEKQYMKLLNQLHEIFIKFNQENDENIKLFNSAFNSIYILSKNHNHLSEIAQKELDKLSMILSDFGSNEGGSNENISTILTKFAVAAKIVDISANEKLKKRIILQLNQKVKKYDASSQSEIDDNSEVGQEDEELMISSSIECLQYYFKWDVKKIHDFVINRKIVDGENEEVAKKIEKMKEPCIDEFHEFSNIFYTFLKSKKSSFQIKLTAFKAIGANISLLPILTHETASGISPPLVSAPIVDSKISDSFYEFYHELKSIEMKNELFEIAELPLIVKTIDIGYSAHLFVYNHIALESNENQISIDKFKNNPDSMFAHELNEKVKKLWKKLSQFQPINGKQLYSAISHVVEKSPCIKSADLRKNSRFFVSKFKVFDFIKEWAENYDEDEQYIPIIVTFLFGLSESDANQLRSILSDRFTDVLDKISNRDKLTSKDIISLQIDKKTKKKKRNVKNSHITEKSRSSDKKNISNHLNQKDSSDDENDQNQNNSESLDEIEVVESTDNDDDDNNSDDEIQIRSKDSFIDVDDSEDQDEGGSENKENYESSDVQEIDPNDDESDEESQYSEESEIELQEPDETFIFGN